MGRISDIERLIPAIYEAASVPEGWADVLRFLCKLSCADSALIGAVPAQRMWEGVIWSANLDKSSVEGFLSQGSIDQSFFVYGLTVLPLRRTADLRMRGLAKVNADPGAQRLLLPQGLTQGRFAPLLREMGMISGAAFLKEGGRGPVAAEKVGEIEAILPTLAHAIRICLRQRRLQDETRMLRAALGQLVTGVLTLTDGLAIRYANTEAERILASEDGIAQRLGQLRIADPALVAALQRKIAALTGRHYGALPDCLFVRRPSGAPPYTLVVAPAGAAVRAGGNVAAATLFITDPVSPTKLPIPAILSDAFGLSATEAEVMRLASMGRGMGFVAQTLGISLNTARTHLKAIYAKTGVHHQAALARIIVDRFPPVRGLNGGQNGAPRE